MRESVAPQSLSPRVVAESLVPPRCGATNVQVRELVLQGFGKASGHRIASAFEQELSRLLQHRSLPASWRQEPLRAYAHPLHIHSMGDPCRIGEQLAAALFSLRAGEFRAVGDQ